MRTRVTVIPSDRVIIVDGQILYFDFDAPFNLHALQWHDGKGEIEFTDSTNQQFTEKEYDENVEPYVEAWEKEKARLDAEANKPPVPPTLEEARKAQIAEIDAGYAAALARLRAGYPPDEAQTWTMQAEQARQLATDPQAEALFVRYLASTKGVSVEEMTRRILVNAQNWEPIAAILTAERQLMQEAAEKAQSLKEVEAVKVGYSV